MTSMGTYILTIFTLVLVFHDTVDTSGFTNTIKDALVNWKYGQTTTLTCASNSGRLLNLLNVVCSTAQATNATARDACYGCFSRYATLPQGQQQLAAISMCATMYFMNSSYAACATRLMIVVTTSSIYSPTNGQCAQPYCEFVRCLRATNSNNVIIQCSREVRAIAPVNVTIDADNVRYYINMTSCILAKARCETFNPITGDIQLPGITTSGAGKKQVQVPLLNSLHTTSMGTLRVVGFQATLPVSTSFCTVQVSQLDQANWLNNQCP